MLTTPTVSQRLNYAWNCIGQSPIYGSDCELDGSVDMYSSTLVIPANILVADSSYNFSVVITSISGEMATSSTIVTATSRENSPCGHSECVTRSITLLIRSS